MPNLFDALFNHRPRQNITPEENFLTAAFVHLLQASPDIGATWASEVLGSPVDAQSLKFETQAARLGDASQATIYPDVEISGTLASGDEFVLWHEHKWNSPTDSGQLERYRTALSNYGRHKHLVFIGADVIQTAEARDLCNRTFTWAEVYRFLDATVDVDLHVEQLIRQFQEFLAAQGLGPQEPLSPGLLVAYTVAPRVEAACIRLAQGLDKRAWPHVPVWLFTGGGPHYKPKIWGRVGVEWGDWAPALFVGVLLSHADHRTKPVDPDDTVELFLTIDVTGKFKKDLMTSDLGLVAADLRLAFPGVCVGGPLDHKASPWRKLTMREPLSRVIAGKRDEAAQAEAIGARLDAWTQALFADARVGATLGEYFGKRAPGA